MHVVCAALQFVAGVFVVVVTFVVALCTAVLQVLGLVKVGVAEGVVVG